MIQLKPLLKETEAELAVQRALVAELRHRVQTLEEGLVTQEAESDSASALLNKQLKAEVATKVSVREYSMECSMERSMGCLIECSVNGSMERLTDCSMECLMERSIGCLTTCSVKGSVHVRWNFRWKRSIERFDRTLDGRFDGMFAGMFDGTIDGMFDGTIDRIFGNLFCQWFGQLLDDLIGPSMEFSMGAFHEIVDGVLFCSWPAQGADCEARRARCGTDLEACSIRASTRG